MAGKLDAMRGQIRKQRRMLRDTRERPFRAALSKFFKALRRQVDSRVSALGRTPAIEEIFRASEFADHFGDVVLPHISRSMFMGIKAEYDLITSFTADQSVRQGPDFSEPPEPSDIILPGGFDIPVSRKMRREISDFLKERNVGLWKDVGSTVHRKLEKAVLTSIEEGESYELLSGRISKSLATIGKTNPLVIARTEIGYAMNSGSQMEREELGIENKEWLSTIDNNTRSGSDYNHRTIPERIVPNKSPFTVSGERLMYPTDSSLGASAGNIVNCRCDSIVSLESLS